MLRSSFRPRPDIQIVGEALDGLDAIQKATELQPDLILFDIGLPELNGIEAAKRVRALVPDAKIIFLTQEACPEVVEEALRLGAMGYVLKSRAGSELLPAIEGVLAGRQFVGSGLEGYRFIPSADGQADTPATHRHEILFCSDDRILLNALKNFIAGALKCGDAAIVWATESHREVLLRELRAEDVDIDAATQQGTYISADVAEAPEPVRIFDAVKRLCAAAYKAGKEHPRVAVCGERAGRLWLEGKTDDVIRLERLCSDLAKAHNVDILCVYPFSSFRDHEGERAFKDLCAEHSAIRHL